MGRVDLPYINHMRINGVDYYYFRRRGIRIRLPDPTDPTFAEKYQSLLGSRASPLPAHGTIAWLIGAYRQAPEYRASYEHYLELIRAEHGHKTAEGLKRHHVILIRNNLSTTPGKADNYIKTLSVIMNHAIDLGLREVNPCHGVRRLCKGEYQPWPPHVWQAAIDEATPMFRLALFTLYYSGQRVSDVCRMAHGQISDDGIQVRQQKTGKTVRVPLHDEWAAEIGRVPIKATTILYNRHGGAFTPDAMQERWRRLRVRIGADDYNLHGLRKNACNALAEVGCSPHEISAITGQSIQMVAHYTKAVDQNVLAHRAIQRWEERSGNKSGKTSGKSGKT